MGTLSENDLTQLSRKIASVRDQEFENYKTYMTSEDLTSDEEKLTGRNDVEVSRTDATVNDTDKNSSPEVINKTSTAYPAVKTLMNFGSAYMRYDYALDCLMLLYCKNVALYNESRGLASMTNNMKRWVSVSYTSSKS